MNVRTGLKRLVPALALACAFAGTPAIGAEAPAGPWLKGMLLVATPEIGDPRFARTVIYMVEHNDQGAFGIIINRVMGSGSLAGLLRGFGVEPKDEGGVVRIHDGGPVERGVGFLLHTPDRTWPGTRVIDKHFALSADIEALKAIDRGEGPRRSLFALGYSGWAPGQLDAELARRDWVSAPADEDLVFGDDADGKWRRARDHAGISL